MGYGQTAWSIRNDPRVILRERTNLRTLTSEELFGPQDPKPTLAVADLSFISLRIVLPAIKSLLNPLNAEALVLVKPQFEVGRDRVGKGGVVRNIESHVEALKAVINSAKYQNLMPKGLIGSPLTGPAGNHEYLLWLGDEELFESSNLEDVVEETLN